MLKYKTDIMAALNAAGYNTTLLLRMCTEHHPDAISQSTIQYIRSGKMVGTKAIDQLCKLLQCQPADLIEYVPN